MPKLAWLALAPLAACGANTNDVTIQLAPEVISSIDGSLSVHTAAFADRDPATKAAIEIAVVYTDRNGTTHDIAPVDGTTDEKGVFDATLTGFTFDGTGTVTATLTGTMLSADATFAVLDRTPPVVTITAPANNQIHLNTDNQIQVHVTDEIGVSQVFFETSAFDNGGGGGGGNNGRQRSTVVASGSTDAMVAFDVQIGQQATLGTMVTFYALAADLSGNEAAAAPITVTVAQ